MCVFHFLQTFQSRTQPVNFRGTLEHGRRCSCNTAFPIPGIHSTVWPWQHSGSSPTAPTTPWETQNNGFFAQGKSSSDGCPHQRKQIPESELWDEKPLLYKPEARLSNVSAELPRCCSHTSPALDAAGKLRALQLCSALAVEREGALL